MKIVLASNSPRRRELLSRIGLDFDVIPSNVEEYTEERKPENIVRDLSYKKALCVAKKLKEDTVIIGADTVVTIDNEILGKPQNSNDAFNMLKKLSGKWHTVYTGISVISTKNYKIVKDYESTDVLIKNLSDDMILKYIKKGECFDKAGSYAIQGYGSLIVERINGDYFNVVGLPISKLHGILLKEFNINLL